MVDVWWGIVEQRPRQYYWEPYRQLLHMCQELGLQVQVVMSFHQCGTNVGDTCFIELPSWVLEVGHGNPDIFYTDQHGYRDREYLTLGVDNEPLFGGRTAMDLYSDFLRAFRGNFSDVIGQSKTITTVEVGLGPAGELRYPSYQLQEGKWSFPGIGEFQCYDRYMLASLARAAASAGRPEWGHGGPSNAGDYKSSPPSSVPFFSEDGFENYNSPYGQFFLQWYSQSLIQHGDQLLGRAVDAFRGTDVVLAAKIAGIHWWYNTPSHAPELTAGYYNVAYGHDGYNEIARMLAKHGVEFQFTCMEMRDTEQHNCGCSPEALVAQTRTAAFAHNIRYSGENALPRFDDTAYDQIVRQAKFGERTISSFTYLRLNDELLQHDNLNRFAHFVHRMHSL